SERTSLSVDDFWRMIDKKRHQDEIDLEELDYTKRALKDTNNETHHIRAITTNKTTRLLKHGLEDQAEKSKGYKSKDQEEVNSGENEVTYNKQDVITNDSDNDLREVTESMVGKVERTPLIVDDIDLEEIFINYRDECENIFDLCHSDIMDMRPTSRFTNEITEESWDKCVLETYPKHKIPEEWEKFIQEFFKPKDNLEEWKKAWRGLYNGKEIDENKKDLVDAIYNILGTFIEAFEAPVNILKSGDLEENQYNAQFVSPVLKNALKTICSVDWRILEVPVESSKSRRNADINPFIDKVLASKRADGLARLWENHEEIFVYEQTGPPNFDDVTEFHIHDYKLVRTMRDVLNQRIIFRLKGGMYDHKELASFGALGHRTEVSLFWCTIHQRAYCLREYGSYKIPAIWQDLPVLSEAITTCFKFFLFMKENVEKKKLHIEQKNKLLVKRKIHMNFGHVSASTLTSTEAGYEQMSM
ncbi:12175_t:CDS:2, partial [Ambispora gerdemannii]